MRYLIFLSIFSFLLLPFSGLNAEEVDPYADSVYGSVPTTVLAPTNAVGEPNETYADFFWQDAYIKFDLGEGEEGIGDLKIYYSLIDYGATVLVEFYDADNEKIDEHTELLPFDTELVIAYEGDTPYRYVRIYAAEEQTWRLDAIETLELAMAEEEVIEEEAEEEVIEEEAEQGRLVTLPDDGNAQTQYDSTIYMIGSDNKRHTFPNETVFFSWFENFDDVEEITAEEMANYPLGENITIRPGTYLVKLQSSPNVYAVEPNGILRLIATEEIASDLYTEDWTDLVVDIADGFWGNYEIGEPIDAAVHPTGTVLEAPNGEIVYLSNGNYYSLPGDVKAGLRFQNRFYIPAREDIFALYIDGGELDLVASVQYPY